MSKTIYILKNVQTGEESQATLQESTETSMMFLLKSADPAEKNFVGFSVSGSVLHNDMYSLVDSFEEDDAPVAEVSEEESEK